MALIVSLMVVRQHLDLVPYLLPQLPSRGRTTLCLCPSQSIPIQPSGRRSSIVRASLLEILDVIDTNKYVNEYISASDRANTTVQTTKGFGCQEEQKEMKKV